MNKDFSKEEIINLADKLLIGVSEDEAKEIVEELQFLSSSMNNLSDIKEIKTTEPLIHPFNLFETSLREDDDYTDGDNIDDILSNADYTQGREVEVIKVVL